MKQIILILILINVFSNDNLCHDQHKVNYFKNQLKNRLGNNFVKIKERNDKIKVAIIDTGIDINNQFLVSKIPQKKHSKQFYGYNMIDPSLPPIDEMGHGSHVASIMTLLNPNIEIIPIKYYKPSLSGVDSIKYFNKALKKAVDLNVDIINISGGGDAPDDEELSYLKKAKEKGILIISASGNNNIEYNTFQKRKVNSIQSIIDFVSSETGEQWYYPASYGMDHIISVMSHNESFERESYSNYGKIFDTSSLGGSQKNKIQAFGLNCDSLGLNGTSQATPIITAFVAEKLQKDRNSQSEMKSLVQKFSKIKKTKKAVKYLDVPNFLK